jgi:hypothetical protein
MYLFFSLSKLQNLLQIFFVNFSGSDCNLVDFNLEISMQKLAVLFVRILLKHLLDLLEIYSVVFSLGQS